MEGGESNWSEQVEDLVQEGHIDKAISILHSKIQTLTPTTEFDHLRLSSALSDLAHLYSTQGFPLEADRARSRARDLKIALDSGHYCPAPCETSACDGASHSDGHFGQSSTVIAEPLRCSEFLDDGHLKISSESVQTALPCEELQNDDWEAIADSAPEKLLSSQNLPEVSKPLCEEKVEKVQPPKRRGRGTFSYTTDGLHNNQHSDGPTTDSSESETLCHGSERDTSTKNVSYGTRHVVVLADFPPSTTTIDLEKILMNFKESGVVIRWVNDTVALAVFKSPTIALEACNKIRCPFTIRVLDENDPLLSSIPSRDLEPPRERPKTSTRVATRLIAQGMGIRLPTAGFSSEELKKQERARKDRIVARQNKRDDAWGDDL